MRADESRRGYTLIEVLIVLFIISIVTSVALLSISHNRHQELASFANEVTELVTFAEEQAILQPNVIGLSFNQRAIQFTRMQVDTDGKTSWLPMEETVLSKRAIPDDVQVSVELVKKRVALDETKSAKMPQIIISTNGDITPFTIYVGEKGEAPLYAIIGDANGNVTNHLLPS